MRTADAERQATLRVVLERPPEGVDFGLQQGRGSAYQVVQKQRSAGGDLAFEFTVAVRDGPGGAPAFAGPFVQGPPAQRFVYIDIGTYAGQADSCWSRRLKIPLAGITSAMVRSQSVLEIRISGTGRDGGPTCATAWESAGWRARPTK